MDLIESGTLPGIGSFRCDTCEYQIALAGDDELPTCPGCGGTGFVRASLFGKTQFTGRPWPDSDPDDLDWIDEARESLTEPGQYVAFEAPDNRVVAFALRDWTRIGRSLAADVRFDDPTVSRRHALIVRQPDGMRVLDDRSLNGVFVNGQRVEWSPLADGDEILVGCHSLRFFDIAAASPDARAAGGVSHLLAN